MRTLFLVAGILSGAGLVLAAPRPGGPEPASTADPRLTPAEVHRFADELVGIIDQITFSYYQPINREDLLRAALVGLYQAARKPVPANLEGRIEKASGAARTLLTRTSANSPGTLLESAPSYVKLTRQVREEIGVPDSLVGQNCLLICCHAMTRLLDPHSGIVTADEQQRSIGLDQECDGFGIDLIDRGSTTVVIDIVQPGSPAQKAGLRPGDRITLLNGKPVRSAHPLGLLVLRNRRALDTVTPLAVPQPAEDKPGHAEPDPVGEVRKVEISFTREGKEGVQKVRLTRARFKPETVLGVRRKPDNFWDYYLDEKKKIAHIRVMALGRGTGEELRQVVGRLEDGGLRGLVLDLRWCPGGYLNEAVEVADLFLGEGVVATVTARGKEQSVYRSAEMGKAGNFPLVVLVNGKTMGGGELIAAALQDHKRAVIAGQRSLGKASVQTPLHVGVPGMGLKLTSGTFVRPGGKNLHRFPDSKPTDDWGVQPDEDAEFRVSAEMGKRLEQWWLWQSLRPGESWDRLPLDDPRADPQQRSALATIEKLIKKAERGMDKEKTE